MQLLWQVVLLVVVNCSAVRVIFLGITHSFPVFLPMIGCSRAGI